MMTKALEIFGTDGGQGIGIQGVLRTPWALGACGCTAVSVATTKNSQAVTGERPCSGELIAGQVPSVPRDIDVVAVKIGTPAGQSMIASVAHALDALDGRAALNAAMMTKSCEALPAEADNVADAPKRRRLLHERAEEDRKREIPLLDRFRHSASRLAGAEA